MRYRNLVTGAVINTPCVISGEDWQAMDPAGPSLSKKKVAQVEKAEPEEVKAEAPKEEPKEEPKETKKPSRGAVIKPKKGN